MDISQWPLDRIMQLPDHLFGRRWTIMAMLEVGTSQALPLLVDVGLPDKIVLWGVGFAGRSDAELGNWIKFALGSTMPATEAEFDTLEKLFRGQPAGDFLPGVMALFPNLNFWMPMRMPLITAGLKFVVEINNQSGSMNMWVNVQFEISTIPKEVPDWFLSGLAGRQ